MAVPLCATWKNAPSCLQNVHKSYTENQHLPGDPAYNVPTVSKTAPVRFQQKGLGEIMYMINYKNTYQRKAPLTQRVAAFFSSLVNGAQ